LTFVFNSGRGKDFINYCKSGAVEKRRTSEGEEKRGATSQTLKHIGEMKSIQILRKRIHRLVPGEVGGAGGKSGLYMELLEAEKGVQAQDKSEGEEQQKSDIQRRRDGHLHYLGQANL